MADDDDPIVASYDVYLTNSPSSKDKSTSQLFLLQYPAHRPHSKPYNAARSQTPTSLRLKPKSGFLEIDVPILQQEHYNVTAGEKYGKAMSESRTLNSGGTHGLAGGFTSTSHSRLRDVPQHDDFPGSIHSLQTQTLGGKVVAPTARDPIYLLGYFRQNQLHLSHLEAVVQMRPQLHHVDAEEELNQKRFQSSTTTRQRTGPDGGPAKVESKAIEIKIRDNKDDAKDRSLNENARLLRDIQTDDWQDYEWVDEEELQSKELCDTNLHLSSSKAPSTARLKSSISNGDWLDRMSAPREDGKKGLLAKLRGRERERARRKKAEEEKRQRQKDAAGLSASTHGPLMDMSTDSELSSPEVSDGNG